MVETFDAIEGLTDVLELLANDRQLALELEVLVPKIGVLARLGNDADVVTGHHQPDQHQARDGGQRLHNPDLTEVEPLYLRVTIRNDDEGEALVRGHSFPLAAEPLETGP